MSDRRVVIGKRNAGDLGIYVSPASVDAFTASDLSLVLNISSKLNQLLKLGYITFSQYVPLGFGANPYVLITGLPTMSGVPGYGTLTGPARPSPLGIYGYTAAPTYASIYTGGVGMDIITPVKCSYAVYNQAL